MTCKAREALEAIFREFNPEHMDSVSGTTVGTDARATLASDDCIPREVAERARQAEAERDAAQAQIGDMAVELTDMRRERDAAQEAVGRTNDQWKAMYHNLQDELIAAIERAEAADGKLAAVREAHEYRRCDDSECNLTLALDRILQGEVT